MAKLTIRIDLSERSAIGPGKIRLLELVGESGSISAAGPRHEDVVSASLVKHRGQTSTTRLS